MLKMFADCDNLRTLNYTGTDDLQADINHQIEPDKSDLFPK